MMRRRPTRARVALRAALVFAIAFVLIVAGAGALLAARPDFGGYRFTRVPAFVPGSRPTGNASYNATFTRTADGAIHLGGSHAPAPPRGMMLGSAQFATTTRYTGFPHPYRSDWTLTLTNVTPAEAGPPASDTFAWNAIVAQGMSRNRSGVLAVPGALKRGGSTGTTIALGVFANNAAWRLLHDPVWPVGSFLLASTIAVAVSWRSIAVLRRGPGACAICGYDRHGLAPGAVCPECGRTPAAETNRSSSVDAEHPA